MSFMQRLLFRLPLHALALLLALSLTSCLARAQDVSGLYLTWSDDPTTTMTINWVDLYPEGTDTVWYRKAGTEDEWQEGRAAHTVLKPSSLQRRSLEIDGLEPDTLYHFNIGGVPGTDEDGWTFRTMPETLSRPIRFVTGGDMMHSRAKLDDMSQEVAGLNPDFAVFGGDLAYENGVSATRIADFVESWRIHGRTEDRRLIPVVAAIGNHEVRGGYDRTPAEAPYFYGLFTLPDDRAYYALDFADYLSLIILDSGHTNPVAGEQTDWLADALAERDDQMFLIPVYHYPAYGTTKAPRGKLPIDSPRATVIQENWVPLFDRHGVTAVFENDHHNYKRTHPLRGHQRDDENGIVYLGDGSWGVTPRDVPDPDLAWWLARAEPRNHFWIVDLGTDESVRIRAMDPDGEVFDDVTLPAARTEGME